MKSISNRSGFSLIELSIVIAIAAIMIGSGVMILNEYSSRSKSEQTQAKMEEIMKYLKRFYIRFGRLPCGADAGLSIYNPAIGIENCGVGASDAVPTRELGLHTNYMLDAWGNKFIYTVQEDISGGVCAIPDPTLDLTNPGGNPFSTGTPVSSRVVVILASINGAGPFTLTYLYNYGQLLDFTKNGAYGTCDADASHAVTDEGFMYGK